VNANACAGGDDGWEKRNVLIVTVFLPIAIDLALRSNMQRRVSEPRDGHKEFKETSI